MNKILHLLPITIFIILLVYIVYAFRPENIYSLDPVAGSGVTFTKLNLTSPSYVNPPYLNDSVTTQLYSPRYHYLLSPQSVIIQAKRQERKVQTLQKKQALLPTIESDWKTYLGKWHVSRYYTVIPNQKRYFQGKTFEADFKMNCSWDCFVTASWYRLSEKDSMKIVACPKSLHLRSVLYIEGIGEVRCEDRWGSIKGKRLDLWMGIGDLGRERIEHWTMKYIPEGRDVYLLN